VIWSAEGVSLEDFGEGAFLVDLHAERDHDRAAKTHALAARLRASLPSAEVVLGAGTVLVEGAPREAIEALLAPFARDDGAALGAPREHRIEAVYDGPDLAPAAAQLGLTPEELIALHAGTSYRAELLGFLPGFAYLGPLDPRLVLPRRPSPRPVVPAGSIGIAGDFTGIYPFASPGGWSLIARAQGATLFDPARDPPSLIQPGDRVRFVPAVAREARSKSTPVEPAVAREARSKSTPVEPAAPPVIERGVLVVAAQAMVTVQDHGRPGALGRGLPPSGPLAPDLLARANAAVGNDEGAAGLEIPLGSLEIEARGGLLVSIDGEPALALAEGERLRVPATTCAVRYLAVQGGVDVPVVLGARATLPVARVGGHQGRALRRGDLLKVGTAHAPPRPSDSGQRDDPSALDVDPGPHRERFPEGALEALLGASFRVSHLGDRVGVRLEGAAIPRDRADLALPVPMRRGAVQVTTEGTPIVLGPDHPITGGYPVLAVLRRDAQARLARLRPGDELRFRLASTANSPFTK
jgi:KipI family sensor histidine kinase inhibitor